MKMSVDRGMHNSGFQFGATGLVQERDLMYQDDDEERMLPWLRIGQAKKSKLHT